MPTTTEQIIKILDECKENGQDIYEFLRIYKTYEIKLVKGSGIILKGLEER